MRVTGAQALARAALPEPTIALQARWGSSAIRTYIRKAPLAATHAMAAMAVAGWERNRNPAGPPIPFAASSAGRAIAARRRAPAPRTAQGRQTSAEAWQAASDALSSRVDRVDQQMQELAKWRADVHASIPAETAEPAEVTEDEVPVCWNTVVSAFPFVYSYKQKCHRVLVGYPQHPSTWRSKCGSPFGFSSVAKPAHKLPACHKSICERCCRVERAAAMAAAESRVREVGGDAH